MMADFVRAGVPNAERRLARLTAALPVDDPCVAQVVAESRVVGLGARLLAFGAAALAASATAAQVTRLAGRWRHSAERERRVAGGVVLLTAAIVHIGLTALQEFSAGWLWALLPGIAIAIAAVLLGFAAGHEPGQTGR